MMRLPVLRHTAAALCCAAIVSGCGNGSDVEPGARLLTTIGALAASRIMGGNSETDSPASDLELREAFVEAGQKILRVEVEDPPADLFLAPVTQNQGITTWVSNERINLSTRDGVILSTRGFGSDLMAATVPTAAQIGRGSGSHDRLHVYLDGGDQTQKFTYTCTVATIGPQTITVLGLAYPTRHITETCVGKTGTATNHYWFQGSRIRQSVQYLVPGGTALKVSAIID